MDFIVHPSDWPELRRILAGLDFVEASGEASAASGAAGPALDWTYSPYFRKGSLFLEFHANPLGLHFPSRGEDGFWSSAGRLRVRGTEALVLPAENELCYLCVHAQQHSYQRLIWLADIAGLAGRAGLDWDWVSRIARDERIRGPVFYGLHLAETLWPGAVPPEPRDELRPGPVESAGLRLLWPRERDGRPERRAGLALLHAVDLLALGTARSRSGRADPAARSSSRPEAWLASTTGVAANSPRLYGRYLERLLRPALTAARRMMDPK